MFDDYLLQKTLSKSVVSSKDLWKEIGGNTTLFDNNDDYDDNNDDNDDDGITNNSKNDQLKYSSYRLSHPGDYMEKLKHDLSYELSLLEYQSQCLFCKATYTKKDNIGSYHCSFHPRPGSNPEYFSCCRISRTAITPDVRGCRKCDHTPSTSINFVFDRWPEKSRYIRIPLYLSTLFRFSTLSKTKIIKNNSEPWKDYIIISRIQNLEIPDE